MATVGSVEFDVILRYPTEAQFKEFETKLKPLAISTHLDTSNLLRETRQVQSQLEQAFSRPISIPVALNFSTWQAQQIRAQVEKTVGGAIAINITANLDQANLESSVRQARLLVERAIGDQGLCIPVHICDPDKIVGQAKQLKERIKKEFDDFCIPIKFCEDIEGKVTELKRKFTNNGSDGFEIPFQFTGVEQQVTLLRRQLQSVTKDIRLTIANQKQSTPQLDAGVEKLGEGITKSVKEGIEKVKPRTGGFFSQFTSMLLAPLSGALQGVFLGVGTPLGLEIGSGLKKGLDATVGQSIGSFELLAEKGFLKGTEALQKQIAELRESVKDEPIVKAVTEQLKSVQRLLEGMGIEIKIDPQKTIENIIGLDNIEKEFAARIFDAGEKQRDTAQKSSFIIQENFTRTATEAPRLLAQNQQEIAKRRAIVGGSEQSIAEQKQLIGDYQQEISRIATSGDSNAEQKIEEYSQAIQQAQEEIEAFELAIETADKEIESFKQANKDVIAVLKKSIRQLGSAKGVPKEQVEGVLNLFKEIDKAEKRKQDALKKASLPQELAKGEAPIDYGAIAKDAEEQIKELRQQSAKAITALSSQLEPALTVNYLKAIKASSEQILKATPKVSRQVSLPDVYLDILKESAKISGVQIPKNLPMIAPDAKMQGFDTAAYLPNKNQIKVSQEAYQELASGKIGDNFDKLVSTLAHEIRHAFQSNFGELAESIGDISAVELITPTPEERQTLGANIEASTVGSDFVLGVGGSKRKIAGRNESFIRSLEEDAYTFESRYAAQIAQSVKQNQLIRNIQSVGGVGGSVVTERYIGQQRRIGELEKSAQASGYGIEEVKRLRQRQEEIKAILKNVRQKALDITNLSLEDLTQVQQFTEGLTRAQFNTEQEIKSLAESIESFNQAIASSAEALAEETINIDDPIADVQSFFEWMKGAGYQLNEAIADAIASFPDVNVERLQQIGQQVLGGDIESLPVIAPPVTPNIENVPDVAAIESDAIASDIEAIKGYFEELKSFGLELQDTVRDAAETWANIPLEEIRAIGESIYGMSAAQIENAAPQPQIDLSQLAPPATVEVQQLQQNLERDMAIAFKEITESEKRLQTAEAARLESMRKRSRNSVKVAQRREAWLKQQAAQQIQNQATETAIAQPIEAPPAVIANVETAIEQATENIAQAVAESAISATQAIESAAITQAEEPISIPELLLGPETEKGNRGGKTVEQLKVMARAAGLTPQVSAPGITKNEIAQTLIRGVDEEQIRELSNWVDSITTTSKTGKRTVNLPKPSVTLPQVKQQIKAASEKINAEIDKAAKLTGEQRIKALQEIQKLTEEQIKWANDLQKTNLTGQLAKEVGGFKGRLTPAINDINAELTKYNTAKIQSSQQRQRGKTPASVEQLAKGGSVLLGVLGGGAILGGGGGAQAATLGGLGAVAQGGGLAALAGSPLGLLGLGAGGIGLGIAGARAARPLLEKSMPQVAAVLYKNVDELIQSLGKSFGSQFQAIKSKVQTQIQSSGISEFFGKEIEKLQRTWATQSQSKNPLVSGALKLKDIFDQSKSKFSLEPNELNVFNRLGLRSLRGQVFGLTENAKVLLTEINAKLELARQANDEQINQLNELIKSGQQRIERINATISEEAIAQSEGRGRLSGDAMTELFAELEDLQRTVEQDQGRLVELEQLASQRGTLETQSQVATSAIAQSEGILSKGTLTNEDSNQLATLQDQLLGVFEAMDRPAPMTGFLNQLQGNLPQIISRVGQLVKGFLAFHVLGQIQSRMQQLAATTFEVTRRFQTLENTTNFLAGGTQQGAETMQFLRAEVSRVSGVLEPSIKAFNSLAASTRNTRLEGEATREIFSAVTQAAAVFGLTGEEVSGALMAVSQMAGKGVVSAEELRGQLAERIPGAFQIAARAMKMTEQELFQLMATGQLASADFLPKFARQLSQETAGGVTGAANTAQGALNRFSTSLTDMQVSMGKAFAPTQIAGLNLMSQGLSVLAQNGDKLVRMVTTMGVVLGAHFLQPLLTSKMAALGAQLTLGGLAKAFGGVMGLLGPMLIQWRALNAAITVVTEATNLFNVAIGNNEIKKWTDEVREGLDKIAIAAGNASEEIRKVSTAPKSVSKFDDLFRSDVGTGIGSRLFGLGGTVLSGGALTAGLSSAAGMVGIKGTTAMLGSGLLSGAASLPVVGGALGATGGGVAAIASLGPLIGGAVATAIGAAGGVLLNRFVTAVKGGGFNYTSAAEMNRNKERIQYQQLSTGEFTELNDQALKLISDFGGGKSTQEALKLAQQGQIVGKGDLAALAKFDQQIEALTRKRIALPKSAKEEFQSLQAEIDNLTQQRTEAAKVVTETQAQIDSAIANIKTQMANTSDPQLLAGMQTDLNQFENLKKAFNRIEDTTGATDALKNFAEQIRKVSDELARSTRESQAWLNEQKKLIAETETKEFGNNQYASIEANRDRAQAEQDALRQQIEDRKKAAKELEVALQSPLAAPILREKITSDTTIEDLRREAEFATDQTVKNALEQAIKLREIAAETAQLETQLAESVLQKKRQAEQDALTIIERNSAKLDAQMRQSESIRIETIKREQLEKGMREEVAQEKINQVQLDSARVTAEITQQRIRELERAHTRGIVGEETFVQRSQELQTQLLQQRQQIAEQEIALRKSTEQRVLQEMERAARTAEAKIRTSENAKTSQIRQQQLNRSLSEAQAGEAIAEIQTKTAAQNVKLAQKQLAELRRARNRGLITETEFAERERDLIVKVSDLKKQKLEQELSLRQAIKTRVLDELERATRQAQNEIDLGANTTEQGIVREQIDTGIVGGFEQAEQIAGQKRIEMQREVARQQLELAQKAVDDNTRLFEEEILTREEYTDRQIDAQKRLADTQLQYLNLELQAQRQAADNAIRQLERVQQRAQAALDLADAKQEGVIKKSQQSRIAEVGLEQAEKEASLGRLQVQQESNKKRIDLAREALQENKRLFAEGILSEQEYRDRQIAGEKQLTDLENQRYDLQIQQQRQAADNAIREIERVARLAQAQIDLTLARGEVSIKGEQLKEINTVGPEQAERNAALERLKLQRQANTEQIQLAEQALAKNKELLRQGFLSKREFDERQIESEKRLLDLRAQSFDLQMQQQRQVAENAIRQLERVTRIAQAQLDLLSARQELGIRQNQLENIDDLGFEDAERKAAAERLQLQEQVNRRQIELAKKAITDNLSLLRQKAISQQEFDDRQLEAQKRLAELQSQQVELQIQQQRQLADEAIRQIERVNAQAKARLDLLQSQGGGRITRSQLNRSDEVGLDQAEKESARQRIDLEIDLNRRRLELARQTLRDNTRLKEEGFISEREFTERQLNAQRELSDLQTQSDQLQLQRKKEIQDTIIRGIDRELSAEKRRSDLVLNNLEAEKSAIAAKQNLLDKERQILDAQLNLRRAISQSQEAMGQIEIDAINQAMEAAKTLSSDERVSPELRTALEAQMGAAGFSAGASPVEMLRERQQLEDEMAARRMESLLAEQEAARTSAALEAYRNELQAKQNVLEAEGNALKAESVRLEAELNLKKAEATKDAEAIANAEAQLQIARRGEEIAAQNLSAAMEGVAIQQYLSDIAAQTLQVQQQSALAEERARDAARDRAQAIEAARLSAERMVTGGGGAQNAFDVMERNSRGNGMIFNKAGSFQIPTISYNPPTTRTSLGNPRPANEPGYLASLRNATDQNDSTVYAVAHGLKQSNKGVEDRLDKLNQNVQQLASRPTSLSVSTATPVEDSIKLMSQMQKAGSQVS